jgi:hypothetical protein
MSNSHAAGEGGIGTDVKSSQGRQAARCAMRLGPRSAF